MLKHNQGFDKIDKILPGVAKSHNLEQALYRHQALRYWQEAACAFVEECRNLTRAVDLKKGVLIVACLSRQAAYKIKLLAEKIIEVLNKLVGRKVVFAISIEL